MNRHVMRKFETAVRAPFCQRGHGAFGWLLMAAFVLAGLAALALWHGGDAPLPASEPSLPVAAGKPDPAAAGSRLATLTRGWVPNLGQWDGEAAYSAPGFFGTTWVTKAGELRHVLLASGECAEEGQEEAAVPRPRSEPCPGRAWVLGERFVGGHVAALRGEDPLPTRVSYFIGRDAGRHKSGLPGYGRLVLGEVWPGIEVYLKATQRTVEKVFVVGPGADPGRIRVALAGGRGVRLSEAGDLVVATGYGEVVFSRPVAWQEEGGTRRFVEVRYTLDPAGQSYGFALGHYDPNRPLYIDPILQATYLGGSGDDWANALAVAPSGDVYVAGRTESADFPRTAGGAQGSYAGGKSDAFVVRLSADLTQILQATYLGGSIVPGKSPNGEDEAYALAVAPSGEVYVAGVTESLNFPGTTGGAQEQSRGRDAFVARLSADLQTLVQATYLGGSDGDVVYALAIVGSEIYAVGTTSSIDFPGTAGGAQEKHAFGGTDAFVARLNSSLTRLLQATYLGGRGQEWAYALAVHPTSGEVYVAGYTDSTGFPGTAGGAQENYAGGTDAFVARLSADLTRLQQATYLGGSDKEKWYPWGASFIGDINLAIHPANGEVYVAGITLSTDFPGTSGGVQESRAGVYDAFVVRLSGDLIQLLQATYLGGNDDDLAYALAIHPTSGEVYVAGVTLSADFPGTAGGAQPTGGGSKGWKDAFVARLNSSLTNLEQATYLGGSGGDGAQALAIHPTSGEVYVAGGTGSDDFPGTSGGAQLSRGGANDAFVARLSADLRGGHRLYLPLVVKAQ